MTRRIILTLSLIAGLFVQASFGQHHKSKEVNKEGSFGATGLVSIENKYGNITVRSWKKDSVRINAHIRVSSKSRDRLAQMEKRSHVSVYLTRDFADIKTVVDESTLAKEWRNLKNIATSGDDEIEVTYVVDVPEKAKLEIHNRFGNTYINNHVGRINITSEHGDVRLGSVPNLERADVSFGKLFARKVERPELDLAFCDLDISTAKSLKIDSKSSTMHIGSINTVYLESMRDKINIKQVDVLDVNGSLSKLEVGKLGEQMNLNLRYGKLWVQEVMPSFRSMRFRPKHCTVYLNFTSPDRIETTIKGEDISIDYDSGMGELKRNGEQYEGYLGSVTSSEKVMYISGEKSSFTIDFEKNK